MKDFRQLDVWHKAHELTLAVYQLTRSFPSEERYGLASQMRRSSSSMPANLAEGCGRVGDPELSRFCVIAMGSASELEYHLTLARDLTLISESDHRDISRRATEVKRMLAALIKKLAGNNRNKLHPALSLGSDPGRRTEAQKLTADR